MARFRTGASMTAVLAAALALAGCFEITKDATFRENGEASVVIEIAIAAELAAIINNPVFSKQMGQEGATDVLRDCGKPWPAGKPLPDGVRSVETVRGKRGDTETCTLVIDVADPVTAIASVKEMQPPPGHKVPPQDVTLVRLDGRPGFRFRAALTPPNLPRPPGDTQNVGKALLDALFANRHVTIGISAQQIERSNGELAPGGRRVTWRLPIAELLDPGRDKPLTLEADIIYR